MNTTRKSFIGDIAVKQSKAFKQITVFSSFCVCVCGETTPGNSYIIEKEGSKTSTTTKTQYTTFGLVATRISWEIGKSEIH